MPDTPIATLQQATQLGLREDEFEQIKKHPWPHPEFYRAGYVFGHVERALQL